MPIRYKYKDIDKLLKSNGWDVVRVSGSHFIYKHVNNPQSIPVPRHGANGTVPVGTVNNILKLAGLKKLKK